MNTKDINEILAHFERTSDQFFSKDEFREKLKAGRKLRIKYGVDVTAPMLHIGHAVNLWLMRYMQDMGHQVVFLIGDFTTRIGDPDGKLETRPVIPRDEIERNARHFIMQAQAVLRFDDPELLEIRYNADWLDKMPLQRFLDLLSQVTHAKLVSRDMFQKRIQAGREIHMHEMLYPVLQGWDSVAVESDLTIIGSDQLFNEMMGRFFQERNGQAPQTIITTKITPGTDGKNKQSKSLGNYVGLAHSPRDKFGRVMSIPDQIMEEWFVVYTDIPMIEMSALRKLIKADPREAKLRLATAIVARYHGADAGKGERDWFENAFSRGQIPEDIPVLPVISADMTCFDLVKLTRPGKSKSDTRRLIKQGGIEINGDKAMDPDEHLLLKTNDILKVGKRNWYRIEIVNLNEMETDHLLIKPLELQDIDLIAKYMPEWEIVKYLTRPLSAKIAPKGKPAAAAPFQMMQVAKQAPASKASEGIAREVFKKVIGQPEPKDEWLWKIMPKSEPEEIIGVAHLRRDEEHGNQNVWLKPEHRSDALAHEAMAAINKHAFEHLNFSTMVFKNAFHHAAREMEDLKAHFGRLEQARPLAQQPQQPAQDANTWTVTREAWQQAQQPATPALPPIDPAQEEMLRLQMEALMQQQQQGATPPATPPQGQPAATPPAQPAPAATAAPAAGPPAVLPPGVPRPPGWEPGKPLPPGWIQRHLDMQKQNASPPPPTPKLPPTGGKT